VSGPNLATPDARHRRPLKIFQYPSPLFQVTEFTACLRRNVLCLMKHTIGTADDCLIRQNLIVHPDGFPKARIKRSSKPFIPSKCKKAPLVAKRKVSFKKYPTPVRRGMSPALQGVSRILTCFYGNSRTKSSKKCSMVTDPSITWLFAKPFSMSVTFNVHLRGKKRCSKAQSES
jgi:hypothetical protein